MDDLYVKLLNFLPVGACIVDPAGRITFINDQYCRNVQEEKETFLNADLYSEHRKNKLFPRVFLDVLEQKRDVRVPQIFVNEEKYAFNLMINERPILNEDDEIDAILVGAEYMLPMGRVEDVESLLEVGLTNPTGFIFESPAMREVVARLKRIAKLPVNILLTGESGVGKDKLAEYIHSLSGNRNAPLVTVNCAAIAENLIESELFGYENGAFTGASKGGKKGLIEQACGGTLFLDEINSLPLGLQGKLLRVLETKMIRRVGGTTEYKVDFRLISASNRNLEECVKKQEFREDLYYRINVFTEHIPPLRERKEDIIPLLGFFTESFAKRYHIHFQISKEATAAALSYPWPGNVRELRNFAEQMVVVGTSPILRAQMEHQREVEARSASGLTGDRLKERMEYYEKEIIREALKSNKSKRNAAKELGIDPAVLSRKIAKYGLKD